MKPISRDGKSLTENNYSGKDPVKDAVIQKWIKKAEDEERMVKAFKMGLSEFLDETTATLKDVPQLGRIIYTNKEIGFVLFHLDQLNAFSSWEEVKEFIHKNFQGIRSTEDLAALINKEGEDA